MEIRWDTARMGELAVGLERKSARLMALRGDVLEASARVHRPAVELHVMVIASLWAGSYASDLTERRRLLEEAESQLLWNLLPATPDDRHRPPLRSRDMRAIEADLDVALDQLDSAATEGSDLAAARAELRIMELTYELAVATQHQALMERRLPGDTSALSDFIDYLGYQIALAQPEAPVDWNRVTTATAEVRRLLDESWFSDVGRKDLLTIHKILADLQGPDLDAVIRELSDDELYRWFHEFDGVRGGNLSEAEEAALFDTLASTASAPTLFRLAEAEGGSRFMQISTAIQQTAPAEVAMEYIEVCAAHASASDSALMGALAGLSELDRRRRSAVVTSMGEQSLLEPLAAATTDFIDRQTVERDDPLVIEFFEGIGSALGTAARTLADLTVVGLVDRDRLRESWSRVGGLVALVFTDPIEFVAIVVDFETLRHNPARWLGSAVAGFATAGFGRLARLGRLGKLAGSTANWFKRLADTSIVTGRRLQLRAGHAKAALGHVGATLGAAAIRESLTELALVESYLDERDLFESNLFEHDLEEYDDRCAAVPAPSSP